MVETNAEFGSKPPEYDIDSIISEASKLHGVEPELIRAMIKVESGGKASAKSPKGARGLMQLMPSTAKEMGVKDIANPRENVMGGTKYIAKQLKATGGDIPLALARYNAGPGNVEKYGGIPPFKETKDYIDKVTKNYGKPEKPQSQFEEISFQRIEPLKKSSIVNAIEISPDRIIRHDSAQAQSNWQNLYMKARPYLKTAAEMTGLTGGAVAGSGLGPWGTLAGGALGYGMGEKSIDFLDETFGIEKPKGLAKELTEAAEAVRTGAVMTGTGEVLGYQATELAKKAAPIVKKIGQSIKKVAKKIISPVQKLEKLVPTVRKKSLEKVAAQELLEQGTKLTSGQIEKNIEIAKKLENKIPDLKFTRGQVTNDAQAIALERSLIRSGVKINRGRFEVSGAVLNQEQRAFAEKALQDYYNKILTSKGEIGAFAKTVKAQKVGIETRIKALEDVVNAEIARLSRIMDEQDISPIILKRLKSAKQATREQAKKLYNMIPDEKLPTYELQKGIKQLIKSEDNIIEPRTKQMIGLVRKVTTRKIKTGGSVSKDTGYQALRKLRSRIGKNIGQANSGANPNLEDARQLKLLLDEVDNTMGQMEYANPEAKAAYEKATKFYKEEYDPKFRKRTVAEVLQRGTRGEETKIAMSNIARKFFNKDAINDFYKAVGNDKIATDALKDYARFDLFNKAYNPHTETLDTKKVFGWIHKNKSVLEKIGMRKEFVEIAKKTKAFEVAPIELDMFNKSVAARILNASPDKIVEQAFNSSKNFSETARELLRLTKGDKAAEQGIKKAIAEHILNRSKVTAEGFFTEYKVSTAQLTKQIKKFMPALKVLYKNEPKKLRAILDVHKAYRIANRSLASPIGGGSDTMENISHILAAATGARAGRYYLFVSIKKAFTKYTNNQVNKYLLRASFDPDYATNLIALANLGRYKYTEPLFKRLDLLMKRFVPLGVKQIKEKSETE